MVGLASIGALVALMATAATSPAPSGPVPPAAEREPVGCTSVESLGPTERTSRAEAAVGDAVAAFGAGEHAAALAALDLADCYEPRPEHAFMRGVILVSVGDCTAAARWFDTFLAGAVPDADRAEAERLRRSCEPDEPGLTAPLVDPPPPRIAPSITREALPSEGSEAPTLACPPRPGPDTLGIVLTSLGAVVVVGGGGLLGGAQSLKRQAPDRPVLSAHDQALRSARVLNSVGWGAVGVGGAVLVGGIVRLVRERGRRQRERARWPAHCREEK